VLEDQVIRRIGGVRDMQVNVRVIAASNRDLEKEVREGRFRQDLYYRLAIIAIFIPPLREQRRTFFPWSTSSSSATTRRFSQYRFAASPTKPAACCCKATGGQHPRA